MLDGGLPVADHCSHCCEPEACLCRPLALISPASFLQAKYVGTGHADLTRWEWAVNVHRDSYASYIGHHPQLAYFAVAENESIGRKKYEFLQKMLLPCGIPPKRADDEE